MSSETYRQSTSHPNIKKLREVDPNNHFLAYREPRRLTAEELRDGMLVSSGELNRQVGGLPSMPEIMHILTFHEMLSIHCHSALLTGRANSTQITAPCRRFPGAFSHSHIRDKLLAKNTY